MTGGPIISVLLPCRDAEGTLGAALESLSAQTFDNFEIIAVDDGSVDGTGRQLDEWANLDDRIHVLHTSPRGIVAALNSAADLARGGLLARMDADDIAKPTRFERQVELLEQHPEVAACGSGVRYFPRGIVRDGARRYEQWINSVVSAEEIDRDLFVECPIPHPTLLVRRECFEEVGRYRDNGWPEDYDLLFRLWEKELRLGKVAEELLEWRESATRLSRTDSRYSDVAFRNCKAHFIGKRIADRKVVVCGAGPVGKAFARALKKQGHIIAAFSDLDPRKIGQHIHGALVIHPDAIGDYPDCYFVAAVGSAKGRAQVREQLKKNGFEEPEEFCAVA